MRPVQLRAIGHVADARIPMTEPAERPVFLHAYPVQALKVASCRGQRPQLRRPCLVRAAQEHRERVSKARHFQPATRLPNNSFSIQSSVERDLSTQPARLWSTRMFSPSMAALNVPATATGAAYQRRRLRTFRPGLSPVIRSVFNGRLPTNHPASRARQASPSRKAILVPLSDPWIPLAARPNLGPFPPYLEAARALVPDKLATCSSFSI